MLKIEMESTYSYYVRLCDFPRTILLLLGRLRIDDYCAEFSKMYTVYILTGYMYKPTILTF